MNSNTLRTGTKLRSVQLLLLVLLFRDRFPAPPSEAEIAASDGR